MVIKNLFKAELMYITNGVLKAHERRLLLKTILPGYDRIITVTKFLRNQRLENKKSGEYVSGVEKVF